MVAQIVGTISALNAGGIDPSTGGPSPFGPGYMQSILPLELRGLINSEHGDQESSSVYGEVYYDLDDTTKLTVGLRYDENSNYFQLLNTLGDATVNGALSAACSRAAGGAFVKSLDCGFSGGTAENDAVTGKISIQKAINDDVMVYGLVSTGMSVVNCISNSTSSINHRVMCIIRSMLK